MNKLLLFKTSYSIQSITVDCAIFFLDSIKPTKPTLRTNHIFDGFYLDKSFHKSGINDLIIFFDLIQI